MVYGTSNGLPQNYICNYLGTYNILENRNAEMMSMRMIIITVMKKLMKHMKPTKLRVFEF